MAVKEKKRVNGREEHIELCGIKVKGDDRLDLDENSKQLLECGWALRLQIEKLQAQLDEINEALLEGHGPGCTLMIPGLCRASLAERRLPKIIAADKLRAILGGRFDDLVREEVSYKAEGKLLAMAADGDEPLAPALRECISYAVSQAVTWRAEK